ncbi:hypothetical protein GCM10022197_39110 [Microlunatus spumicola]|uniref:Uncharacterized protein n=1 Tax=Microlunatus spumicola TaxID=81499 RepID=A0ABP6Y661_9ACTN
MSEPTVDRAPETGDPRVDAALRGVDDLAAAPVDEHAERLSTAHNALQEVLRTPAEAAAAPRPPAGPRPPTGPRP